jgi:hypothetical protein
MTDQPIYDHDGRTLRRRDAHGGYIPIGVMCDEDMASYVAAVLNDNVAEPAEDTR